jgi:hypothetical protein
VPAISGPQGVGHSRFLNEAIHAARARWNLEQAIAFALEERFGGNFHYTGPISYIAGQEECERGKQLTN